MGIKQKLKKAAPVVMFAATTGLAAGCGTSTDNKPKENPRPITQPSPKPNIPSYPGEYRTPGAITQGTRGMMQNPEFLDTAGNIKPFDLWKISQIKINEVHKHVSKIFREMFVEAYGKDTCTAALPYTYEEMEQLLKEYVTVIFAFNTTGPAGVMSSDGTRLAVSLNDFENLSPERLAYVIVHEFGHLLGMGEANATLLGQICVPSEGQEQKVNWVYNSQFTKAFLESGKVDPRTFFWEATGWESDYKKFWTEHNPDVDYDDFQLAAAVSNCSIPENLYCDVPTIAKRDEVMAAFNNLMRENGLYFPEQPETWGEFVEFGPFNSAFEAAADAGVYIIGFDKNAEHSYEETQKYYDDLAFLKQFLYVCKEFNRTKFGGKIKPIPTVVNHLVEAREKHLSSLSTATLPIKQAALQVSIQRFAQLVPVLRERLQQIYPSDKSQSPRDLNQQRKEFLATRHPNKNYREV